MSSYLEHPNLAADNASLRSDLATLTAQLNVAHLDNVRLKDANRELSRKAVVAGINLEDAHADLLALRTAVRAEVAEHVGWFGARAAVVAVRRIVGDK